MIRMLFSLCLLFVVCVPFVVSESFFYAGDRVVAVKDSVGEVDFLFVDRVGSDVGSVVLPFGRSLVSGSRFFFTGKELDGSGLFYFVARYYDGVVGRFFQVDPVVGEPAYVFVYNNPLRFVDPFGTSGEDVVAGGLEEKSVLNPCVRCTWFGPTTGSDPVMFILQVKDHELNEVLTFTILEEEGRVIEDDGSFNNQYIHVLEINYLTGYQARVRAEDAQGRTSSWSEWSDLKEWVLTPDLDE